MRGYVAHIGLRPPPPLGTGCGGMRAHDRARQGSTAFGESVHHGIASAARCGQPSGSELPQVMGHQICALAGYPCDISDAELVGAEQYGGDRQTRGIAQRLAC